MAVIDQNLTWRKVEDRLATEKDPVLRRNLELLLRHMQAEAHLDLDAVMATVSERAHYHMYSGDPDALHPRGKAAVRKFYEDFAASGAGKLHQDIDRLVVDRDCILTEGLMRIAYPGRTLGAMGIEVDDPEADYLFEARMAIVWPIDEDGLFIGEDSYVEGDGFAGIADRKLDPADIVLAT
ncbi:MAG: nuclear transport factor 2 family protein [Acidimicrobiales bacterium]